MLLQILSVVCLGISSACGEFSTSCLGLLGLDVARYEEGLG